MPVFEDAGTALKEAQSAGETAVSGPAASAKTTLEELARQEIFLFPQFLPLWPPPMSVLGADRHLTSTISPAISKKYREALQENKQNLLISQNKQRAAGQFVADILEIFEESPGNIEHPAS